MYVCRGRHKRRSVHHALKTYGEVLRKVRAFLTSATVGGWFTPRGRTDVIHWIGKFCLSAGNNTRRDAVGNHCNAWFKISSLFTDYNVCYLLKAVRYHCVCNAIESTLYSV